MQALHGEGVAGDDARDGEHAHGDGAVEGPDETVAVAVEPFAVAEIHARSQVVLVQRVLGAGIGKLHIASSTSSRYASIGTSTLRMAQHRVRSLYRASPLLSIVAPSCAALQTCVHVRCNPCCISKGLLPSMMTS